MEPAADFHAAELSRRRRLSARVAWALFAVAAALYGLGFLVPR